MKAFEIHLNGQHFCTIGVGEDGILTAIVTWVIGDHRKNSGLTCHVGGVDGATDEHLDWQMPAIKPGDEVLIKVIEAEGIVPSPDPRRKTLGQD